MDTPALTLYFDGACTFCSAEMARLGRWDTHRRLAFVDIAGADFCAPALGLEMRALDAQLHARTADGTLLVGIDSMLAAYTLTGHGALVWPLRVRPLRPALSYLYRSFARHRYTLSRWLGYGAPACGDGVCRREHPFL
jgi:predicted DCC family thiol-disulfide oxidoreductase YuxK